jgi:hypothetical protein
VGAVLAFTRVLEHTFGRGLRECPKRKKIFLMAGNARLVAQTAEAQTIGKEIQLIVD